MYYNHSITVSHYYKNAKKYNAILMYLMFIFGQLSENTCHHVEWKKQQTPDIIRILYLILLHYKGIQRCFNEMPLDSPKSIMRTVIGFVITVPGLI